MTTLREAATQLLTEFEDVLEIADGATKNVDWTGANRAIKAVQQALAQPESEPSDREALIAGLKAELANFAHNKTLETLLLDSVDILEADAQKIARKYISPVRTVADLANNLLLMDQALPIYGAQYIDHPTRGRCAIAVPPTVSRERVQDSRWIGQGNELNAAVVWTKAAQQVAVPPGYALVPIEPTDEMLEAWRGSNIPYGSYAFEDYNDQLDWENKYNYRAMLKAAPQEQVAIPQEPNNDEVIYPSCCTQFRAIPVNVQRLMLDAGFEPPFVAAPQPAAYVPLTDAPQDIHAAIMNIPCRTTNPELRNEAMQWAYKIGHRDARHAAAELAIEQAVRGKT